MIGTTENLISSEEYAKLDTKGKRTVILDYFFRKYNELGEFTYIKPKDFKSDYKLTSNQQRTLNRNFQWFWLKYVFKGNTEDKKMGDPSLTTEYKIRTKEDDDEISFNYNIPKEPHKRRHYATLLIGLLNDTTDVASQIPFYSETAQMSMGLITQLTDGVVKEVLLASKIYEYFKCNSGSLLNIIAELSHFKQSIQIEFKNRKKIKNGIIKSIGIYEDGEIELIINDETLVLDNIDEIKNIFVLSKNYPTSDVVISRKTEKEQRFHKRPSMNRKILLDSLKQQKQYKKMVEIYSQYCVDKNIIDDSLEKFINRLSKTTKECLNLTERANRRIKVITEV